MPRTAHPNHRERRRSAGFTLIEILVTLSIIAILAAISIPAMSALFGNAAQAQTKTLLKQMDSSISEYEAQTQRKPFVAGSYGYVDGSGLAQNAQSFKSVYDAQLASLEPALEMIDTVNESYRVVNETTGELLRINDAWDRPVRFFPGTLAFEQNAAPEPDAAALEDKGMHRRKSPYFASAGPDGFWGQINPATDAPFQTPDGNTYAEDNLYSFEAD